MMENFTEEEILTEYGLGLSSFPGPTDPEPIENHRMGAPGKMGTQTGARTHTRTPQK